MRGNPKQNTRSNITLSVDNDILNAIKTESKELGVSLNSKIVSILGDYVSFGRYMKEAKPVVIAPEAFSFIIENLDEQKHLELWKFALKETNTRIFAMHNVPLTLENIIKYSLSDIGIQAGIWYSCTTNQDQNGINIIIRHIHGLKWSQLVSQALAYFIKDTFNKTVDSEILHDTIKPSIKQ